MHVKINGASKELPGDMAPLAVVLEFLGMDPSQTGIAVAVNGAVVPRSEWGRFQVQHNDELEVITARQGG